MIKNPLIIMFIIGLLFLVGCNSSIEVSYEVFEVEPRCFDWDDSNIVIQNEADYYGKLQNWSYLPGDLKNHMLEKFGETCSKENLPMIDFSKNTILGKITYGSGCSREFVRKVIVDNTKKIATYSVEVINKGGCQPLITNNELIIIPKIPEDYTIEFSVSDNIEWSVSDKFENSR